MKQRNCIIPGISCNHCIKAIQNELTQIKGVVSVAGNPPDRRISVVWSAPASEGEIRHVTREGMLCGLAALSDALRTEAAETVRRLRKSCTRFRSPAPWI
ncbi:MAG: heavy metal translocating P-type ATPase [Desulfobacterales bacterium]|nr:heavy metal translocating P-type ATPase [Desulfobacterales bacterium]MDD3081972.1 heavy metal translocating P-type ATPase [Desulfobacterales bacterium]MDD3951891.1 heavy metal translocating P-type ATPase [Desulfobacterales bacterium]MDY0378715.1 heavy metal translocating P-type ATPase [Desulfobacterales bacterium]